MSWLDGRSRRAPRRSRRSSSTPDPSLAEPFEASGSVGAELPRVLAHVLRRRAEDGALDRDPAMDAVVVAGREQTLDRNPEQHDAAFVAVDAPARDAVGIRLLRQPADLEAHFLELRPSAAQEFHCRADGHVEAIDAAVQ